MEEQNQTVEMEIPMNRNDVDLRFKEYVVKQQIVFLTFHPSLSYEEFIEGITFDVNNSNQYLVKEGIFKKACAKALHLALLKNNIQGVPQTYNFKDDRDEIWSKLIEKYDNLNLNTEEEKNQMQAKQCQW